MLRAVRAVRHRLAQEREIEELVAESVAQGDESRVVVVQLLCTLA
jgi:hypothetical protein